MHLTQLIDVLQEILAEHGDIEVVRITHSGDVRTYVGPELAHRHIRYKNQLTTHDPERSAPVVKI